VNFVKTIGKIRYILYKWDSAKWGWNEGIYFVSPRREKEFIVYIKPLKDICIMFVSKTLYDVIKYQLLGF